MSLAEQKKTTTRPSLNGVSSLDLFHVEVASAPSSDDDGEEDEERNESVSDASERLEIVTTQRPFRALTFELRNVVDRFSVAEDASGTEFILYNIGKDTAALVDTASTESKTSTATPPQSSSPARKPVSRKSFVAAAVENNNNKDYTLYNHDMSKILLSGCRVTGYHWTQLRHRAKHADLELYVGNNYQNLPPVAVLRSTARSSRVLQLQRFHDKGVVYALTKDKIMGHRVFFISEGTSTACRMVLIVRKGRATIKFMTDPAQRSFNATCMEYSEGASEIKVARGMDLVLVFACLCVADRFEKYKSFADQTKF